MADIRKQERRRIRSAPLSGFLMNIRRNGGFYIQQVCLPALLPCLSRKAGSAAMPCSVTGLTHRPE